MSSTCSVSFYSTIRLIFCICLYRHCLKWKLQPIMCNWIERLCLPHWWPLLQNLLFFLCVCHQNENPLFVRVNKQWFAAYVLSIKSSSRTRYMHFPCDVLPKPTYKLYNLANFPGQFLNVESRQKKSVCKWIFAVFAGEERIIFPESSVDWFEGNSSYFPKRKTSSKNIILELSSEFCSVSRTFRPSWHCLVLTLSYSESSLNMSHPSA